MKCAILILLLAAFGIQSHWAQNNPDEVILSSQGAEMMPGQIGGSTIHTFYDKGFTNTLPQNTVDLYEEKFKHIISAFNQHELMKPPTGFEARFEKRINVVHKQSVPDFFFPHDALKTAGSIEVFFAPYYRENGKAVYNFKFASFLQIYLNNPHNIAGTPVMADIYPCPQKTDSFHGHEVYATDRKEVSVINFSGKPLYIPVSQEEFIHVVIAYWQHKIQEEWADKADYEENTSEQMGMQEKQSQKEEFERAYNELLKYDKTTAEELKKVYQEAMDLNLEETHNAAVFDNSISFEQAQINSLKEELSAMSAQERKRQAIYEVNAFEMFNNVSGLMPEEYKDEGDALVRINPNLVEEHPEKIQLLSMHWYLLNRDVDEPRLYRMSEDAGLITDNKMALIYSDREFWSDLFQLLQE